MSNALKENLQRWGLLKTLHIYFISKVVAKTGLHICWVFRFKIDIKVDELALAENQQCHALSLEELKTFSQDPKVDLDNKHFVSAIKKRRYLLWLNRRQ